MFCMIGQFFANFFVYTACTGGSSYAVTVGIPGFSEAISGLDNCGKPYHMVSLFLVIISLFYLKQFYLAGEFVVCFL